MPNHFGRSFNNIESEPLLNHLKTLEEQGCIYQQLHVEELGTSNVYRLEFRPNEIFRFVEAMYAYEEFRGFRRQGYPPDEALGKVSSEKIRDRVHKYNEWAVKEGESDLQYCPAAFYGRDLESLLTSYDPERHEIVPPSMVDGTQD